MMNIVIPTIGSRGDVQPFIALAQGLKDAGHAVTLASHPVMQELVQNHGVPFHPIGPDIDLARDAAAIRDASRNPVIGLMRAMRFSFDLLEQAHGDILALLQSADLAVISAQSAAGKNEADRLGIPYLSVTLMPWAIPWDDPARPIYKRVAYGALDGLVGALTTRPLNQIRRRQGLPPVGQEGFTSTRMNLIPVSPAVYAPNPRWEPRHISVGYWFVEEPAEWEPPPELLAFLEAGEAPLVVSLGAMSLGRAGARESAACFVDAIHHAGLRAILQGWESGVEQLRLPTGILAAGSLPHSWLLPRCTAMVHHGGFGTTSAALRAGIPALIIPHIADQFYWGEFVHRLGAGPQPIRRTRLNVESLAESMKLLVRDVQYRTTAASLGAQIRAEDGVGAAVRMIEQEFLRHPSEGS